MTAPKFVGDANREPQLRIGVLTATLRHALEDIECALIHSSNGHNDLMRVVLNARAIALHKTLELMAKADGA